MSFSNQPRRLSRRTVLRGVGASLALPWFESLAWAAGGKSVASVSAKPPVRWGCLLFANGVNPYEWWAKGDGDSFELSKTLAPLEPHKRDVLVLRQLHVFNNTSGPHWPLFSNYLNGVQFKPTLIPEGGESIDQLIARHAGRETPVPSLVLGIEPAESGLRSGVPSVYYGTVSWSSKNTPVPPEIYPRAVFDRLFDTTGLLRDKSVLDAVLAQAKSVRGSLAGDDRRKLDDFLTSVRDVELRIERAAREERLEGWRPSLARPDMPRPGERPPQNVADHMRLMLDLIVLAWRMDKTRVATLVFNRDVSHMQFSFLDGVPNEQLHGISHHKDDKRKLAAYQRINQFHVEQLAYLLDRMKQIDEGAGTTLLDNAMVLFGSNMFNGDSHDGRNLPLVLAGRGGGTLRPGRALDFGDRPEGEQRFCNLHLAMARRMGIELNSFGDAVGELPGLE
jgi:hypothetical protein